MFKKGEVVLIPVPFSDLKSNKKRPVLIMSSDEYNLHSEDVICMAITSQIRGYEHEVIIDTSDMEDGQLPKESCIRADKIYTLNQAIIIKKYGRLKQEKLEHAFRRLEEIIRY